MASAPSTERPGTRCRPLREAAALIGEVFGGGASDLGSLLSAACLDERSRVWVGRVDGRPVTTAIASISDGFVGVYRWRRRVTLGGAGTGRP